MEICGLNNEEKKAIEGLFHLAHINTYLDLEKEDVVKISRPLITQWKDNTEIVLNLIENQQKEIEELKEVKWYYEISRVSKDKIKAILKKYGKKEIGYAPDFYKEIQSLLEEE